MILSNKSLAAPDVIRNLGLRFWDYRLRLRMTRKEVSETASIGRTTLYKFESGNMTDISFSTLLRLLRVIGLGENWEALLPELPESPYMYDDNGRKVQRVRHSSKKWQLWSIWKLNYGARKSVVSFGNSDLMKQDIYNLPIEDKMRLIETLFPRE